MRTISIQRRKFHEPSNIDELNNLAKSAGYDVISYFEQLRPIDGKFQIGSGKAKELGKIAKELKVDKIIFDNELTPLQVYNLRKIFGVEVIDRFQLILEIFAKRAETTEAKLQIQLVTLKYQLPRAREYVRLAKMGEQSGFLGSGKYDVDIYYEDIKRRIFHIRNELKKIKEKRKLHRLRRLDLGFSLVSLAGYTSAGKTTLFNTFTKEKLPVNIGLFTTLSTTTRQVMFGEKIGLLTDTVGFIERLPITLIEAFHSTLEETILSDVIILVIDISEDIEIIKKKLLCCLNTIKEIGAGHVPIVTALNKSDLLKENEIEKITALVSKMSQNPIVISALNGYNLENLKQIISKNLTDYKEIFFYLPFSQSSFSYISKLKESVSSVKIEFLKNKIYGNIKAQAWFIEKTITDLKNIGAEVLDYQKSI